MVARADETWQQRAACRGPISEYFFPPLGSERPTQRTAREARAKEICGGCSVRAACLDHAIASREVHGIWGGLDPSQRQALVAQRQADLAECAAIAERS